MQVPEQSNEPEPISLSPITKPLEKFAKRVLGLTTPSPVNENPDLGEQPAEAEVENKPVKTLQIPEIEARLNKADANYPEQLEQLIGLYEKGIPGNALLIPKTIQSSIELGDILAKTHEEAAWPHYLRALKICKQRG